MKSFLMKKRWYAVGLTVVLAVVGIYTVPAFAEGFVAASKPMSSVATDQVVDGSAYLAGETVTVKGTVKGDVYCAGQNITISGIVEGDVLCAGQNLTIAGEVRGDIRVAGVTVNLRGSVGGNATVAGATVVAESSSKIGGDITVGGDRVDLSGVVGRDVMLGSTSVLLGGVVGRDVRAEAASYDIANTAKVGGSLSYVSRDDVSVPSGVVTGKVTKNLPSEEAYGRSRLSFNQLASLALMAVAAFAVFAVLIALVIPRYLTRVSTLPDAKQATKLFLVGISAAIVTPVVGLMLAITVIGLYAAIALFVAYILTLMVAGALVAYRVGRFMMPHSRSVVLTALVGALVGGIVSIVPFVGPLAVFVATMIGVGMVVLGFRSEQTGPGVVALDVPVASANQVVPKKRVTKKPTKRA